MMEKPGSTVNVNSNGGGSGNESAILRMLESIDKRLQDQEVVVGKISRRVDDLGEAVDQVSKPSSFFVVFNFVRIYLSYYIEIRILGSDILCPMLSRMLYHLRDYHTSLT
jgi:hypothetical protein